MYKKILVPLDGSELAECVLPHVEAIVKGCLVSTITLLRAIEPVDILFQSDKAYPFTNKDSQRLEDELRSSAALYLNNVTNRFKDENVEIQSEVLSGEAAETISDYVVNNEVDLIVIATHGRSGISRWVWGSVTERVLRAVAVPVLLVRAPGCGVNLTR